MLQVLSDRDIYIKRSVFTTRDNKDIVNYNTVICAKNADNRQIKCYLRVKFPKGIDMPNNTKIKILDAMIAFNPYSSQGEKYPYIFIRSYEIVEMGKSPEEDGSAFEDLDDYSFV